LKLSLTSRDQEGGCGLKEPEPQEISISGTTTSTGEVSSGTGDSKDAPWVEVMNRKAQAKKTKRLREQEERKLLRESEAKVSPLLKIMPPFWGGG